MSKFWNKNLFLRLFTGFAGGPLILFSALYGKLTFIICLSAVAFLCLNEIYGIASHFRLKSNFLTGYVFSFLLFGNFYLYSGQYTTYLLLSFAMVLSITAFSAKKEENPFPVICYTYFWTIYIICFLGTLILIRGDETFNLSFAGKIVGLILLALWSLDTFAYFGGKSLGKHKLSPRISPNKTIEGSLSGILGAVIIAVLYKLFVFKSLSFFHVFAITIIISVFGQVGDLIESLLKRKAEIKDSSNALPGHGGMLDRFDSLIFCSPFLYFYIKFFLY